MLQLLLRLFTQKLDKNCDSVLKSISAYVSGRVYSGTLFSFQLIEKNNGWS